MKIAGFAASLLILLLEGTPARAAYNPSSAVGYANQWYQCDTAAPSDRLVNHYNNPFAVFSGTGSYVFQYVDANNNALLIYA